MSLAVALEYSLASEAENPRSTAHNLGGARVDAKGTTQDYLTHPSAIPGQKMALNHGFSGVVKTPRRIMQGYRDIGAVSHAFLRRRGGAGST